MAKTAWPGNLRHTFLMKFTYHGLQIEMPNEWWTEAEKPGFMPLFKAYRVNHRLNLHVREVPLEDVGPVSRNSGVGVLTTAKKRVPLANESCEFCAASGLTTPSRQWKSQRAKLDTCIDISWFMARTAFIVRLLLDSSVSRPSGVLTEWKAQGLFGVEFRSTLALRITNSPVVSS